MNSSAIFVWRSGYCKLFGDLKRVVELITEPGGLMDLKLMVMQYAHAVDRRLGEPGSWRYVFHAISDVDDERSEAELRHVFLVCAESELARRTAAMSRAQEWYDRADTVAV